MQAHDKQNGNQIKMYKDFIRHCHNLHFMKKESARSSEYVAREMILTEFLAKNSRAGNATWICFVSRNSKSMSCLFANLAVFSGIASHKWITSRKRIVTSNIVC